MKIQHPDMRRYLLFCGLYLVISTAGFTQSTPKELGVEFQYATGKKFDGFMAGASYENFPTKSSWSVGLQYSFSVSRKGKEPAKGSGFGFSAGYRWGLNYGTGTNAILGLRTTFSFNKDKKGNAYSLFIPSVEFGSHFTFNKYAKGGYFTPTFGLAYPFSMSGGSQTEADYQGLQLNTRLGLGYRF